VTVLRKALKVLLPLMILAAGALVMRALVLGRDAPRREARADPGPLVETLAVGREDRRVVVEATGTVQARREVSVTPQVSGRVVRASPNLVVGGFVAEGETLFEIESADYELTVARARAAAVAARYELTRTETQARVAREEWARLALDGEEANPLVLYGPQLESARAGVAAAAASVRQAELDLERTAVRAPFAALVRSEQVEVGQYVRVGAPVATLAGTAQGEVVVPVAAEDLRWLRVPGPAGTPSGSPAVLRSAAGGGGGPWKGRVVRSLGEVDPQGRMTRLVVAVSDPYGLADGGASRPLELGSFVAVEFEGTVVRDAYAVPRSALRDGGTVWVVDGEDRLRMRPVTVGRLERREALVTEGLSPGERVVLTALSAAADGMRVRPIAAGGGE
jgi:RND family efflux transporter MFP subunit